MFFKMFNTQRNVFLFFKQLKIELSQHLWIIQAYKHSLFSDQQFWFWF